MIFVSIYWLFESKKNGGSLETRQHLFVGFGHLGSEGFQSGLGGFRRILSLFLR